MSITGLGLVINLVKEGVRFFTTRDSDKLKERKQSLEFLVTVMRDNKKQRSVISWVGLILVLAVILFDISTTGGENIDLLLVAFGAWGGA